MYPEFRRISCRPVSCSRTGLHTAAHRPRLRRPAEKKESAEDCEQYIRKDSSSLNEKLTEYVWNTAADGKATLFENEEENCVYVVVRDDVTTMKTWLETQNEGILHGIKDDAFDELLKSTYDSRRC